MTTPITTKPTEDSRITMRAVVQERYGSADVLRVDQIPVPRISDDEVLVEVVAAGVDRGVWHLMTGLPYAVRLAGYGAARPKNPVPGMDVAGRVVAVGDRVTRFQAGDEVFGIARGSYAQYAAAKADKLSHKPERISFEAAGVSAISGITALQAVHDVARVRSGQHVLVIGASGGVGGYVTQIAKAAGANVTGVASAAKADLVRSLGADRVIDYSAEEYLDGSTTYDVIIDTGGLNPVRHLRRALARKGTLVIVGGEGGGRWTGGVGRQLRAMLASAFVSQRMRTFISAEHHSHIDRLAVLIDAGSVVPAVGRRYGLEQVPEAIADLAAGRAAGKSVVVVRSANPPA